MAGVHRACDESRRGEGGYALWIESVNSTLYLTQVHVIICIGNKTKREHILPLCNVGFLLEFATWSRPSLRRHPIAPP